MKKMTFEIGGMSCGHCVACVRKALSSTPGLSVAAVEVGKATVDVDEAVASEGQVRRAIEGAGFELKAPSVAARASCGCGSKSCQ